MKIFIIVGILLLLSQIYVIMRLISAFGKGKWMIIPFGYVLFIITWMCLRFFSPFKIESLGLESYVYGGVAIFWALWYGIMTFDLVGMLVCILNKLSMGKVPQGLVNIVRSRMYLKVGAICSLPLFAYMVWETQCPRETTVIIETDKLPPGTKPLKIAGIADIHVSHMIGQRMLTNIKKALEEINPDILIISGDTVDTDVTHRDEDAAIISQFPAKFGKFGVTGNHDQFQNHNMVLDFMRKAKVTMLHGELLRVGNIQIAGVDDRTYRSRGKGATHSIEPATALNDVNPSQFTILLNHQPVIDKNTIGKFDLQFSGHTHGGQLWPGSMLTKHIYGFAQGLTPLTKGNKKSLLFITNGVGFWGLPVRFLSRSEIVVFIIKPRNS